MIKDSKWLEEKIAQEERKIAALEAGRNDPNAVSYNPQGTLVKVLVPAFMNPDETFYIVSDREDTINFVCSGTGASALAKIGCLPYGTNVSPAGKIPQKYNTRRYPRVLIITGGSPEYKITKWGTRYLKKYAKGADKQSHRLIPFGHNPTVAAPQPEDVYDYFVAQFEEEGDLNFLISGGGSASLILGKNEVIASISG
ncbi:MAG: hypothetical protein F6K22_31340 [Okeania sp. SIO2F4]|uniref:hypothetical protein n=1 Tax=Okeania sp. SIO2F4 TaxID=2607790 RepID=UPI00142A0A67|nr:hypothetical protein [Okeania sp. SIO2F4]NES06914.1 hypothetical protein [Okeania sp. SIO2F4]